MHLLFMGFVPADVVRLEKEVKFSKLCNEQIKTVEKFFEKNLHGIEVLAQNPGFVQFSQV